MGGSQTAAAGRKLPATRDMSESAWRMHQRSSEARIKSFLAMYSPEVGAQFQAVRTHLRSLFPRGHDLVFDNYNALVFAFSPTERS